MEFIRPGKGAARSSARQKTSSAKPPLSLVSQVTIDGYEKKIADLEKAKACLENQLAEMESKLSEIESAPVTKKARVTTSRGPETAAEFADRLANNQTQEKLRAISREPILEPRAESLFRRIESIEASPVPLSAAQKRKVQQLNENLWGPGA